MPRPLEILRATALAALAGGACAQYQASVSAQAVVDNVAQAVNDYNGDLGSLGGALTAREGELCTVRGPMMIVCASGLECIPSNVEPGNPLSRPIGVCAAAGSEEAPVPRPPPQQTIEIEDRCPADRVEAVYAPCDGLRPGWDVNMWSWDTSVDLDLDARGYGGLPSVAHAPVCGAGLGGNLPTIQCECDNYLGTCGYTKARYDKGFAGLSYKTSRPLPIEGRLRFRLQIAKDPDELEMALRCPEQVFMGPPTLFLQVQSGRLGEDGSVASNTVDVRRCMSAPSEALTAGCWAVYEINVVEGEWTMEGAAMQPCTLWLPRDGNGLGDKYDTIAFKSSLDGPAEEAGCGVGEFYLADLSVCSATPQP